jgi:hypothetical protein
MKESFILPRTHREALMMRRTAVHMRLATHDIQFIDDLLHPGTARAAARSTRDTAATTADCSPA